MPRLVVTGRFALLALVAACSRDVTAPVSVDGVAVRRTLLSVGSTPPVVVAIDVQPGKSPNTLSAKRPAETVPVAIYSSATFDATTLDPTTITLGDDVGTDTPVARSKTGTLLVNPPMDLNADGRADLLVYVKTADLVANGDLTLTPGGSATLVLAGQSRASTALAVRGTDRLDVTR